MNYRYKPGDKVLVIDEIKQYEQYKMHSGPYANKSAGDLFVSNSFEKRKAFTGKIVTIDNYDHSAGNYLIKEDGQSMFWCDDMFVGSADNECFCSSLL